MTDSSEILRVCIDARLRSGQLGGVEQVVIGLASGLSRLEQADEEYHFLAYEGQTEWIEPYLGGACQLLHAKPPPPRERWKDIAKTPLPVLRYFRKKAARALRRFQTQLPCSDGTIEAAKIHVMHMTQQMGFLTEVPSIYHPHDLQHIHLPQFFSRREYRKRETVYRVLCNQARVVSIGSTWGKRDLLTQYGLSEEKVAVIELAPPISAYHPPDSSDLVAVRNRYQLPDAFVFYPAQTWAHKNHLGLLEALKILRDQDGLTIPLICSGRQNRYFTKIDRHIRKLGLADQVKFLGFVSTMELQCLYRLCQCVVIPTRFEAVSQPLWEAFRMKAPACCSNVTALPAQAGDAALVFDPDDYRQMADALGRLWTDAKLRDTLTNRGYQTVSRFSWLRTAKIFRAFYRLIGGKALGPEDRKLLDAKPLLG